MTSFNCSIAPEGEHKFHKNKKCNHCLFNLRFLYFYLFHADVVPLSPSIMKIKHIHTMLDIVSSKCWHPIRTISKKKVNFFGVIFESDLRLILESDLRQMRVEKTWGNIFYSWCWNFSVTIGVHLLFNSVWFYHMGSVLSFWPYSIVLL